MEDHAIKNKFDWVSYFKNTRCDFDIDIVIDELIMFLITYHSVKINPSFQHLLTNLKFVKRENC